MRVLIRSHPSEEGKRKITSFQTEAEMFQKGNLFFFLKTASSCNS